MDENLGTKNENMKNEVTYIHCATFTNFKALQCPKWNCSQDFKGKHHPNWSDLKYPTLEPLSIMLRWRFVSKNNPSPQNKSLPMNFWLSSQLLNSHTGSEEKGESGIGFNGIWHG
jgi:hypothetical protein